jgi:retron-type reverse transcriptase
MIGEKNNLSCMKNNKRRKTYVHWYNHIDRENIPIREVILADRNVEKLFIIKKCS